MTKHTIQQCAAIAHYRHIKELRSGNSEVRKVFELSFSQELCERCHLFRDHLHPTELIEMMNYPDFEEKIEGRVRSDKDTQTENNKTFLFRGVNDGMVDRSDEGVPVPATIRTTRGKLGDRFYSDKGVHETDKESNRYKGSVWDGL